MKMFDYKIDTTMLPTIWVTWTSTKGGKFNKRYWLNCKTGKKTERPQKWMHYPSENEFERNIYNTKGAIGINWRSRNENNIWVKSGTAVRFAYVKYHKKIDMLEVAVVGVDTTRRAEPHPWKYLGDRYFIRRDKVIVNQNGNTCDRYNLYPYHEAWNANVMFSMLARLNYNDKALDEFKKFIGDDHFSIGNGRCINIEYLYHMQEWYKTKQRAIIAKGNAQQMIDALVEYPLSDMSDLLEKHFNNENRCRWYRAVCFERINDEWSVLRTFSSKNIEMSRMYINDNGKTRYAIYNKAQGWIAWNAPTYKYNYSYLLNKDEGVKKCKRIKYAIDTLSSIDDCYFVNCLYVALRMPEFEQLSKLGGKDVVKDIIMDTYPKAKLKHWAGEYYNEKEKNILRKIGLNKNQLSHYAEVSTGWNSCYYRDALKEMRKWFGNDLSHIDLVSFKKYLEGLSQIKRNIYGDIRGWAHAYGFEYERFIKNLIRLGEKNVQTYRLLNDTVDAYRYLRNGTRPEINWYFDDYSDLVRVHDAVVALRNAQIEEQRAYWRLSEAERLQKEGEKLKEIDEKRKEYEYEDDTYIIRLPKDLPEIVNEGTSQHICIGGYTSRHAKGETNLFFLREKNDPDKPFYAIEMGNDKHIVQIHGFGNKWLGNDPNAIPTVIRWLRKNGISCSDAILTCTATGYGQRNTYVAMPVVD